MNLYFRLLRMVLTSWRRRRVDFWEPLDTPFRVQPTDLDTVGHMNNAKYLALMDLGRVDLMIRSGFFGRARRRGWYAVVSAQTIRYRRSLQPRQRFVLRTEVLGVDEKALYFTQTFLVGGDLYAQAVVQCRILSKEHGSVPAVDVVDAMDAPADRDLTLPRWVQDWAVGVRQTV